MICYVIYFLVLEIFVVVSNSVVSDSVITWTAACQASLSMEFSSKNTGGGCHSLFQGIFLIQGSNPDLLHCRQILYHLSHQGSRYINKQRSLPSWSLYSTYSPSSIYYVNRDLLSEHYVNLYKTLSQLDQWFSTLSDQQNHWETGKTTMPLSHHPEILIGLVWDEAHLLGCVPLICFSLLCKYLTVLIAVALL